MADTSPLPMAAGPVIIEDGKVLLNREKSRSQNSRAEGFFYVSWRKSKTW
jgi:hypothetical protein